ncbi:MAG: hypothetical protein U0232_07930 [Thermomicrobiales bacterium]
MLSTAQQRIFDRDDSWWAAKSVHPLPTSSGSSLSSARRDEDRAAGDRLTDRHVDRHRPVNIAAGASKQNPKITTWTGNAAPYGYRDWRWPVSIGFSDLKEPFNDPDVRWAINHCIDRRLVAVGYQGAGRPTLLPFQKFPALEVHRHGERDLAATIDDFSLDKYAAKMRAKGFAKNGDRFWAKGARWSIHRQKLPRQPLPGYRAAGDPAVEGWRLQRHLQADQGRVWRQSQHRKHRRLHPGHGGSVRDP